LVGAGGPNDRLFREGNSARLKRADSKTLDSGIVILSYQPADRQTGGAQER
jgi:hypothetical protein